MELCVAFLLVVPPTFTRSDDKSAVFSPAASKMALMSSSVVVFPFVPVTPMTISFLLG